MSRYAPRGRLLAPTLLLAALWAHFSAAEAGESDPRQRLAEGAPPWLNAIGRLTVPSLRYENGENRHFSEDCSASLIGGPGNSDADTIVTAWHCLEHYQVLSRTIEFTLLHEGEAVFSTPARPLADGGRIESDWALLRLQRSVPASLAVPLALHDAQADRRLPVIMAGFSRDGELGDNGRQLTYHAGCRIVTRTVMAAETDCVAFKGASGGAVVQLSAKTGRAELVGVISQGDSRRLSIYIPASRFRNIAMRYLGAY